MYVCDDGTTIVGGSEYTVLDVSKSLTVVGGRRSRLSEPLGLTELTFVNYDESL